MIPYNVIIFSRIYKTTRSYRPSLSMTDFPNQVFIVAY